MHPQTPASPTSTTLRPLQRRRGRPRQHKPRSDLGTPELQMKRLMGHTAEPLDVCLQREWISAAQHRAGLHLRWLYTLRYGLPSVTALDPLAAGSRIPQASRDPEWLHARETEYRQAIDLLTDANLESLILRVVVFHESPMLLTWRASGGAPNPKAAQQMAYIRDGLELLHKHWENLNFF